MTWTDAVWFAGGLVLGVAHAAGIWRHARRLSSWTALLGLMRFLIVGLALAMAAIFGGIFPAAAGWAAGFCASVIFRSRERQGQPDEYPRIRRSQTF